MWGKAVAYCRQGANAAAGRSAYREAADRYAAALAALSHEAAGREATTLGIDIRFEMGTALRVLVDHAPLFDLLVEAERLAAALGDERRSAWVQAYLSMEHWWKADHLLALESGRRALEWSRQHEDRGLEAVAQMAVGWAHHALGQFRVASRVLQQALDETQQDRIRFAINRGSPLIAVLSLSWLTTCLAELGEFEEGRRRADEAIRLAEEANHPWSRVAAYYGLGVLHTQRSAFEAALVPLEQAFQLCNTYDIPGWGTTLAWWLGYARALSGDAGGERRSWSKRCSRRRARAPRCINP